jgi:tetratricopeptide (TPR) repeat protein
LPAEHDPVPSIGHQSPATIRPITSARAVAEYAGLLLFPRNLHMDRNVEAASNSNLYEGMSSAAPRELQTLLGIGLLGAALYGAIRARRHDRVTFLLLVSTGLTYLPMAGILHLNASVAEHWVYVPSAFLFLLLTVAIWRWIEAGDQRRFIVPATAALAAWTLFLGTRTFIRTFDWKDQRTFLERTIAAGGDSARMLNNLGGLELSENHLEQAKKNLVAALKKEPDQPFAIINLAAVAIKQNDFHAARELLLRATGMPAVEADAHELRTVLDNKENGRADVLRLRLAAHTGPSNWTIEKRYIKLLAETGAMGAAIHELQTRLQSEWYRAESWQLLGQLLLKIGRPDQAAEAMACANSYDVHLSERPTPL